MSSASIVNDQVEQPGFFSRVFGLGRGVMQRATAFVDGSSTKPSFTLISGVEGAMRVPAVNACVNAKVNAIAMLPIVVNELNRDTGKVERKDPLRDARARILGEFWNDELTAHDGMARWVRDYIIYGRAYVEISRHGNGVISALNHIPQDRVTLTSAGYKITSKANLDGSVTSTNAIPPIEPRNMLVLRYDSDNTLDSTVKSPVQECMDSINLSYLLQQSSMDYFKRGAPPFLMKLQFQKDKKTMERMTKQMKAMLETVRKCGTDFGLAPADADIVKLGNTPQEGQFVAQRTFQIQEVCRILNVPPSVIHENSRSTYSNAAQATSAFLRLGLQPLMDKIKQEMNLKIFGSQRNSTARVDFDTLAFERTEMAKHLGILLQAKREGNITANEMRAELGYNVSDQEGADTLTAQMQNQPIADENGDGGSANGNSNGDSDSTDDEENE